MTRNQVTGFTLVEMMVVIMLLAILLAIGVPEFRNFAARRTLTAQVGELANTIRLTRTEAIKRGFPVSICRSDNPEAASPGCSSGAAGQGWSSGWVMFVDRGTRGVIDAGDVVIRVQPPFTNSGGINTPDGSTYTLTFLPSGIAIGAAQRLIFSPKLPTSDPSYSSLQKVMCISFNGSTRLVEGATTCS